MRFRWYKVLARWGYPDKYYNHPLFEKELIEALKGPLREGYFTQVSLSDIFTVEKIDDNSTEIYRDLDGIS